MSPPPPSTPEPPKPLLSEEVLPTGTIAWVGIGSLALFALGTYAAYLLLTNRTLEAQINGPSEVPAEIQHRDAELGIVDQQLFTLEHRQQDEHEELTRKLNSYGWNEGKKSVH